MRRRARLLTGVLVPALALTALAGPVIAKPKKEAPAPAQPPATTQLPPGALPLPTRDERLPEGYQLLVRKLMVRGPADTLGDGFFTNAEGRFLAGQFDQATAAYGEFTQRFPRNLRVNQALERMLLIADGTDFDREPLRIYARAEGMRHVGHPDSAEVVLTEGLARYPGARLRWHYRFALAELARDRGDHAGAIVQALAVADTSSGSRLAPAALKLAGDETLASGGPATKASEYYQALLERYPDSPLAPGVRAQLLLLRKKMQL